MSGESTGVNINTVDDYKRRIPDIVQSYSPDNILKAQKPRCFKNIKPEQLPVTYIANKKAWMTHDIFFNMD